MVFGLIGLIVNVLTFPGIVANAVVQDYYADRYGAPQARLAVHEDVEDVETLREMDDEERATVAYVLGEGEEPGEEYREEFLVNYDAIESYSGLFAVVLMPFVVSSVVAFVLLTVDLALFGTDGIVALVLAWLGISLAAHSFPNADATDALWRRSSEEGGVLAAVGYPIVGLSKLVNALRFLWLDFIYAAVLLLIAQQVAGLLPI